MRIVSSLLLFVSASFAAAADSVIMPKPDKVDARTGVCWYDIRELGLEGQGWSDTKAPYDRLPARAETLVRRPVWGLSRNSTGLSAHFLTSSPVIHARWTLTSKNLALPHMPSTGVSGLDLYARTDAGNWNWLANGRPTAETTTQQLASGLKSQKREFRLYLPLYNGVSSVEIGLPKDQVLYKADPPPSALRKPIVFYGTSITQGGCASRPGMVHTSIISRKLDRPAINLGFSGNGTLDLEMAPLMADIDAALYVLDCLPNLTAMQVEERSVPFVRQLRKFKPETPILMVEDRTYTNAILLPGVQQRNRDSRAAFKKAYESLQADGMKNLFYMTGESLLGDDGEGTVDGSHPTDLGFLRQADAMIRVMKPILEGKK